MHTVDRAQGVHNNGVLSVSKSQSSSTHHPQPPAIPHLSGRDPERGTAGPYLDYRYGMVEVCEGAPVAVSGWVLTDRHDLTGPDLFIWLIPTGKY